MYESPSIDEIKPRTNIVPALAAVSDVNILAPDRHQQKDGSWSHEEAPLL